MDLLTLYKDTSISFENIKSCHNMVKKFDFFENVDELENLLLFLKISIDIYKENLDRLLTAVSNFSKKEFYKEILDIEVIREGTLYCILVEWKTHNFDKLFFMEDSFYDGINFYEVDCFENNFSFKYFLKNYWESFLQERIKEGEGICI